MIASLVSVIAKSLLLFLCGYGTVTLAVAMANGGSHRETAVAEKGFLGAAASLFILLIISVALWAAGLYSHTMVIATLAVYACAVGAWRMRAAGGAPGVGAATPGSARTARLDTLAGTAVFLVAMALAAHEYRVWNGLYQPDAINYFLMGYPLMDGSENPFAMSSYGVTHTSPVLYFKFALMFFSALMSHGDRFEFLAVGVPALGALITGLVFMGAYYFFLNYFSRPAAMALGALFLLTVLRHKILSVRAETIGWIPGFAFLILFDRLLRGIHAGGLPMRRAAALAFASGCMLVTAALTHGVVGVVVSLFALGMWAHSFIAHHGAGKGSLALSGVAAAMAVLGVIGALYATFPDLSGSVRESAIYNETPVAGAIDPAARYRTLIRGVTETKRRVLASPPYLPLYDNLRYAVIKPWTGFWYIPALNRWPVYPVLIAAAAFSLVWLVRRSKEHARWSVFFIGCAATFAGNVAFSVYLNYSSVFEFPWRVFPNRFMVVQQAMALMLLVTPVAAAAERMIADRADRAAWLSNGRWFWPQAVFAAVLIAWAVCLVPRTYDSDDTGVSSYVSDDFREAVSFLRERARPGDVGIANFHSVGHMKYLTGVAFISEGASVKQVYGLMRVFGDRIEETLAFSTNPNTGLLRKRNVRWLVVSSDPPGETYPFVDFTAADIESLGVAAKVFENGSFVIYQTEFNAAGSSPAGP